MAAMRRATNSSLWTMRRSRAIGFNGPLMDDAIGEVGFFERKGGR